QHASAKRLKISRAQAACHPASCSTRAPDEMVAEVGFHNAAGLANRHPESRLFEWAHHLAAPELAQVATAPARRTVGMLAGELREVRSRLELRLERLDLLLRLLLGPCGARPRRARVHQQNVGRSYLFCHRLLRSLKPGRVTHARRLSRPGVRGNRQT